MALKLVTPGVLSHAMEEKMKLNVDQILKGVDGKDMKFPEGATEKPDLKTICVGALVTEYAQDKGIDGKEKHRRYVLAQKITRGGQVSLSSAEVKLVKELVGLRWNITTVGAAYELLGAD